MKANATELYGKAKTIIDTCLDTAHIDIVDLCEKNMDQPKCMTCFYSWQTLHLGYFCNNEFGMIGRIDLLNDYCSKHKERT